MREEGSQMKPVLAVLGIGMIVLGLYALGRVAWLGWLEIMVGVLALLGSAARLGRTNPYTGVVLGLGTLLIWIVALASGVISWLTWLTFVLGVAFILTSPAISRPTLPPSSRSGPTIPPNR
jgi:hypothetical protein